MLPSPRCEQMYGRAPIPLFPLLVTQEIWHPYFLTSLSQGVWHPMGKWHTH